MDQQISISRDARRERALAAVWAAIAIGGIALLLDRAVVFGMTMTLLGAAAAVIYVQRARSPRPMLILDREKLTDCRSGTVVPWRSIAEARLRESTGWYERFHYLKLTVGRSDEPVRGRSGPSPAPGSTVTVPIDRLSLGWSQILALAEERLGAPISPGR
jgi:hypothetical protein